jgi:hypothetical protein
MSKSSALGLTPAGRPRFLAFNRTPCTYLDRNPLHLIEAHLVAPSMDDSASLAFDDDANL